MDENPVSQEKWKRRRRRWGLRFAVLCVAGLVLLYFAPAIAARTPLRAWILTRALDGTIRGSVRAGGASFSWFAPPELTDVDLSDENGELVLHAPRVRFHKWLVALAVNQTQLGELSIDQPTISIVCSANDSNLEKLLAPLFDDSTPSSATPELAIRATQATVTLRDPGSGNEWSMASAEATLTLHADRTVAIPVKISGTLAGVAPATVTVDAEYTRDPVLTATGRVVVVNFPLGAPDRSTRRRRSLRSPSRRARSSRRRCGRRVPARTPVSAS